MLADAERREDCRFEFALALAEDPAMLDAALASLEGDPLSRDLLLLRLTVHDPVKFGDLCRSVDTEAARTRCRQVLGRPHLRTPPVRE